MAAGRKTVQASSYRVVTRIPTSWPTPGNWSLWDAIRPKNRIFSKIVEAKRKVLNEGGAPRDYLSKLILNGKDPKTGEPFSPALLRDIAAGLIGPNFLNTALTSSWVLSQFSQHPQVRTRMEEELSEVLHGELPTLPQLRHLTYTQMAIKEAMRFQSSAYAFGRQAIGPDKVHGYYIPAGAAVVVPAFLVHRDPRHWENPLGFDPERFTPERSAGRPRYAYCPWGGGTFKCTGKELGMAEVTFIIATVAQRFRVNLVGDHEVKVDERMMLLAPYDGPFVTIHAK
jgi:cytochrome P450